MTIISHDDIIRHTHNWVADVVVGCNFCPFAAGVLLKNKIKYRVVETNDIETALTAMLEECAFLTENEHIETTLLLYPAGFQDFTAYLELANMAEDVLDASEYYGEFQVASFHPNYLFVNTDENDAANYTNRSLYPMLHLLREASVEQAVTTYKNAALIPDKNIAFAHEKGLEYMQKLRKACKR